MDDKDQLQNLTLQIQAGSREALGPVFEMFRPRLRAAIRLRLNNRIRQRVDESDILQEAYFAAANDLPRYADEPKVPVYVWLRGIVRHRLIDAHRKHLSCQKRTADREFSIHEPNSPLVDSASVSFQIAADLTSPSIVASKEEMRIVLQAALEQLDPIDQEIISLRHVEGLKIKEVAQLLQIKVSTASTRYLRALKKLKDGLSGAI